MPKIEYGILDTKDNLWLGDTNGPIKFNERIMAQAAAQIAEDQITGTDLGCRFQVREIPTGAWRLRDELNTQRTSLKSLQRIEAQKEQGTPWL